MQPKCIDQAKAGSYPELWLLDINLAIKKKGRIKKKPCRKLPLARNATLVFQSANIDDYLEQNLKNDYNLS